MQRSSERAITYVSPGYRQSAVDPRALPLLAAFWHSLRTLKVRGGVIGQVRQHSLHICLEMLAVRKLAFGARYDSRSRAQPGAIPSAPDARCVRKRDHSPLHSMCWKGRKGIHVCPVRTSTTSLSPPCSPRPPMNTVPIPHGGNMSCSLFNREASSWMYCSYNAAP
jgi:hypothetical protein